MPLEVWDAERDVRNLFITPEIRARIMRFEPHQLSAGHTHDVGHEMFLVLAGQAEFTIDGESSVLGPGQACDPAVKRSLRGEERCRRHSGTGSNRHVAQNCKRPQHEGPRFPARKPQHKRLPKSPIFSISKRRPPASSRRIKQQNGAKYSS